MNFNELALNHTIDLLLKGKDYREVVLNIINTEFLDFAISFFKDIVYAKMHDKSIDFSWYQQYVMDNKDPKDIAILCGTNIKTIFNTYGTSTKEVVLDITQNNLKYLYEILQNLENDNMTDLGINIKITYKDVSVNLDLKESLLVINALATKKIALRGSAYSMIGKRIEKPLMLELCKRCGISESHIDATNFKKDKKLEYDREVDFKLFIDAGVSLFGKDQIQVVESNQNTNLAQMNMSDLLALANSSVSGDNVSDIASGVDAGVRISDGDRALDNF
ncbi:CfrBI family restriction endonuclease [Helicobacter pylori]